MDSANAVAPPPVLSPWLAGLKAGVLAVLAMLVWLGAAAILQRRTFWTSANLLGSFFYGEGALAGKTVYVSAGHGWIWDASLARWRTQRGNTHDLVEDFISAETVSQFLIPYLHDMGAYVVPVREADLQTEMLIVDDSVAEISDGATVIAEGWSTPSGPIADASNPFAGGGSRVIANGSATWTIEPRAGGTRVEIRHDFRPRVAVFARFVDRAFTRPIAGRTLATFRDLAEALAADDPTANP